MDFTKLKSFSPGLVCILDSSAILNNPDWETYKNLPGLGSTKNLYLFVGEVLNQVDVVNHQKNGHPKARKFFENLRKVKAKLSDGLILENKDIVYFYTENLDHIPDKKVHYVDSSNLDRKLIELALKIREAGCNVAILGQDSLIQVLCLEFDLQYILFSSTNPALASETASTSPSSSINIQNATGSTSSVVSLSASASPSPEDK